jgi:pyridoxamine 5'-phosphate oxidase-like protein
MSVKVDVGKLTDALQDYGFAYLLTVTDDQRTHAVAVTPASGDGGLTFTDGLGRRTRANLEARPDVTLLWPPGSAGGYTLIADGRVTVSDDVATFVPAQAVLHRPADHGAAATGTLTTGCGNDCLPVGEA